MRVLPNHIALLLALVFLSCERERFYPYDAVEPMLAMHSTILPGSPLVITLEQTGNLSSEEEDRFPLGVATFEIIWNGTVYRYTAKECVDDGQGRFLFPDIVPQPGDEIIIKVYAEGLPECTGSVTIPEKLFSKLTAIEVDETSLNPKLNVDLSLVPQDSKGGYFIIMAKGMVQDPVTGAISEKDFLVSSDHPGIDERTASMAKTPSGEIFTIVKPEGDGSFHVQVSGIPASFSPHNPKQSISLVIYQFTPDYYEYIMSLYLAQNLGGGPDTFTPFDIHSNVSGGIGVVGAYHETSLNLLW